MKRLTSVTLALLLSCSATFAQGGLEALSNRDILQMVRAKLPTDLIIQKINTSSCRFDTFPSVLVELKQSGVPNDVLSAMVGARHGRQFPTSNARAVGRDIWKYISKRNRVEITVIMRP